VGPHVKRRAVRHNWHERPDALGASSSMQNKRGFMVHGNWIMTGLVEMERLLTRLEGPVACWPQS
jgi:hypothetical protein